MTTISPPTPPVPPTTNQVMGTVPPPPPRKKRRLWLKVLLGIVLFVVLLVLLLPTLVSTTSGKNFVLSEVNSRIAGSVEADSLSVGWTSGASMRNLTVKDPDGKTILTAPTVDTGVTILNALNRNPLKLNVVVRADNATLVTYADGTNNMGRAFGAKGATPPPPAPAAPAAPAPAAPAPATATTGESASFPLIATLDVQLAHLTVESANQPTLSVDNTVIKGNIDTVTGATQLALDAVAKSGNGTPATVSVKADGNFFKDGALKPMTEMTGTADATLKALDLAAAAPFVASAKVPVQIAGVINASATLKQEGGKQTVSADIQSDHVTLTQANQPTLALDKTSIKANVDSGTGAAKIALNSVVTSGNTPPATVALNADGSFLKNGVMKPLGEITGTGDLIVKSLDLKAIAPYLEAAKVPLQVTGVVNATAKLDQSAGKQAVTANVQIANLVATGDMLKGDTFKCNNFTTDLQATLAGDTVNVQALNVQSPDVTAKVTGSMKTGAGDSAPAPLSVTASANVTSLKQQLPHLLGSVPDTTATVALSGSLDATKKTFTVADASTIAEKDPTTGKGTTITLKPKSVLSYGTATNDFTADIVYDLARVQGIIGSSLPGGTILQGTHTTTLHLTGALTKDPGLTALRNVSIDPATLGYDRINVKGLDMTKGTIPFAMKSGVLTLTPTDLPANGGTIHLAGRVDCTQNPAVYQLDQPAKGQLFVKDVALNQQIAAGPLAFLPISWGADKNNPSLGTVTGKLNVALDKTYVPLDSNAFKTKGTTSGTVNIQNMTTNAPLISQLIALINGGAGGIAKLGSVKNLNDLGSLFSSASASSASGMTIPDAPFALANGKVTYSNLSLGGKGFNMAFSGSVGMDTSLVMNVALTVGGNAIPIPIGLKGTTSSPQIAFNAPGGSGVSSNPLDQLKGLIPQSDSSTTTTQPAANGKKDVGQQIQQGLDSLFNKKKKK